MNSVSDCAVLCVTVTRARVDRDCSKTQECSQLQQLTWWSQNTFSRAPADSVARPPAELKEQSEVVADGAMTTDLAVGDREDVDLLVRDRPAGGGVAVEGSGGWAGLAGGG